MRVSALDEFRPSLGWSSAAPGSLRSRHEVSAATLHRAVDDLARQGWASVALPATSCWLDELRRSADWFFSLPQWVKDTYNIVESSGHRGYVPITEKGSYADEAERRYEAFDVGREADPKDRQMHALRGRNRYPVSPSFGPIVRRAFGNFDAISNDLIEALCWRLGVPGGLLQRHRSEPVSQMRLIHYNEPVGGLLDYPSRASAMGAHTDYEFFTLLYQSGPGLEVQDRSGRWVEPPYGRGRLTLLGGDLLEVFSGGQFDSTLHRVDGSVRGGRTSIPFFCGADYEATVSPIAGADQTSVHFGQHLMRQLRRDFPYLRQRWVLDNDDGLIDLTDTAMGRDANLSMFERRRLHGATVRP